MAKGLTRAQAEGIARQGKAVRREEWRRWLLFSAWSRTFYEQLPADGATPETIRTALSVSAEGGTPDASNYRFSKADSQSHDWTDEAWEGGGTPPVTMPSDTSAPVTCSCSDGTITVPPSAPPGGTDPSPSDVVYPSYPPSPVSPRVPGRPRPHDPPAGTDPIIRVTAVALDTPTGGICWVSPALGVVRVGVQVTITGGPPGLGGLDLRYQAQTKLLGNGFTGYNSAVFLTGAFRPFFTPGATITFEVRYYAEGRNGKPPLFYWSGTGTLTLAPLCVHAPHTVTFDGHGHDGGSMAPQTSTVGATLTPNAFTLAGSTFAGWNTVADGSGIGVANAGVWLFTADATLYAQWTPVPVDHTVTFDGNGSDGGSMSPQTASASTALDANAFTLTGYDFAGWNTAADGSGTAYADAASYDFAADATLYAQWTPAPVDHTVTFDGNGSDGGMMGAQTASASTALDANAFTLTGSTFSEWNTAADGSGTAYADAASYDFAADVTLYAQWVAD